MCSAAARLLLSILAILAPAAGITALAAEPIKIGAFASITGPASFMGDPQSRVLKMEVDRINQQGGILGRSLTLVVYDDGSDTKQAVTLAQKLINQDQVDVLIGGSASGTCLAVAPIAQKFGVPYIAFAASSAIVEPVRSQIFKASHTDKMAIERVFVDMQRHQISKVGLIGGSIGYDESCRKDAKIIAPKFGITVLEDVTYAPGDTDMTPQFTRLTQHKDLQAVFSCGSQAPAAISTRNYKRLNMGKFPLYFTQSIGTQEYIDAAGSAAEGVRFPASAILVPDQLPASHPQKKVVMEFKERFFTAFKQPVPTFAAHAEDAMLMYTDALKRAGSADKAKVRNALETIENLPGVHGVRHVTPKDHVGLNMDSFLMVEVRGGKFKLIPE